MKEEGWGIGTTRTSNFGKKENIEGRKREAEKLREIEKIGNVEQN
jgi:hypothetical protein